MISGYAWILPAVIAVGWILSWWGARWIRWSLLATGVVVSVLVFVTGFHVSSPPLSPDSGCTREQVQCMDGRPIPWLEAGLFGFACCVLLLIVTTVADIVIRLENRSSVESPH
jgi:O-antigen ligase